MDSPPPKETIVPESKQDDPPEGKLRPTSTYRSVLYLVWNKRLTLTMTSQVWCNVFVLLVSTLATICIIASLEVTDFVNINVNISDNDSPTTDTSGIVKSPFSSTLAFIRFNAWRPERLVYLEKYRPFFREIHYSMPHSMDGGPEDVNTTNDGWENQLVSYLPMARTMQHILDQPAGSPEAGIKGIMFYHL